MARRIAPGTPTPIKPVQMDIPGIDLQIFYKIGDDKIKSATQNFELYATTTANAEAQKAYQKFKNNPIALANALSKLPEMFSDLPESIQTQLKQRLDNNAISLIQKAQANQERAIAKQNKALAHANATLNMSQLADDYFNVLRYITAPEGEKRPGDLAIYKAHRAELEALTNMTDENGNPIFSETQRNKMLMPKDAALAGFKQFINRPELDDLKQWDTAVFQNRDKFKADTGIDDDTYDAMETALEKRIKALADNKVRTIHGQAYYDAINLIAEPTQLNIEKAKAYKVIPDKTINKIAETSKEITLAKYYNPEVPTAPGAFINAITNFSETINNTDWSPEGRKQTVEQAAESMDRLLTLAKESNMSPELVDKTEKSILTALSNKQAAETIVAALPQIENNLYDYNGHIDYAKLGLNLLTTSGADNAKKLAQQNYEANILNAMDSYIKGDLDTFNQQLAQADRQYKLTMVSFMPFSQAQWQQWEKDVENGKDVVFEYNGNTYKFNGFNAQKPITLINLI